MAGPIPRIKLLIRGGSIPEFYGVKISYVDIIKIHYPHLEIINRSRIKENSFQGIWTFNDDIEEYAPDILMLHFGIDDAYQPVYRSEFKENLVQIVRLARKRFGPEIILLTSHPFENLEMEMIYMNTSHTGSSRIYRMVSTVHSYWAGEIEEKGLLTEDFLQEDCRYPNEAGHELYAKATIPKIDSILMKKHKVRR